MSQILKWSAEIEHMVGRDHKESQSKAIEV